MTDDHEDDDGITFSDEEIAVAPVSPITYEEHIEQERAHIETVQQWVTGFVSALEERRTRHDESKLQAPESHGFHRMKNDQPLKGLQYGTQEYFAVLERYPDAIIHHYRENDHHPEHFERGVFDMDMVQMIEMLCDWRAATERMKDGDMGVSMWANVERFDIPWDIFKLMWRTAVNFGMIPQGEAEMARAQNECLARGVCRA